MKRPKTMMEHLEREEEAIDMLRTATPAWREFLALVVRAFAAKAKADLSNVPAHRTAAAALWEDLQHQLGYLARAEEDLAAGPVTFDFTRCGD